MVRRSRDKSEHWLSRTALAPFCKCRNCAFGRFIRYWALQHQFQQNFFALQMCSRIQVLLSKTYTCCFVSPLKTILFALKCNSLTWPQSLAPNHSGHHLRNPHRWKSFADWRKNAFFPAWHKPNDNNFQASDFPFAIGLATTYGISKLLSSCSGSLNRKHYYKQRQNPFLVACIYVAGPRYPAFMQQLYCSCRLLIATSSVQSVRSARFLQVKCTTPLTGTWAHCTLSSRKFLR